MKVSILNRAPDANKRKCQHNSDLTVHNLQVPSLCPLVSILKILNLRKKKTAET